MAKKIWLKHQSKIETLLVFAMAAAVRLTALGVFRAIDEEDRWAWAVDLFKAVLAGDLPATLIGDGYPGVFPAWLETLWLLLGALMRSVGQGGWIGDGGVYLLIHDWGQWSNLALQRFPIALANTVLVVAIFWYVRRLFGPRVAWLAAILISFDPFFLSDSRVNRAEALLTGLMVLSLLALMAYHRHTDRRHLLVSGVVGGLAWLTKSQAIVLLPMFGAINLVWLWRQNLPLWQILRRWVGLMLAWAGLAALTFVALWPAAWVVPADTFGLMLKFATRKVGEEGVNLFFGGRTLVDEDPGWLFYPTILLLRITPVTLLGLLAGLGLLAERLFQTRKLLTRAWFDGEGVWSLVLYSVLYIGGMSLGSHKQDRFLMAIFPALDVLAALALVTWAGRRDWPIRWQTGALAALAALQVATALPYHPYYFPYFNPLLGGGKTAVRLTRVGWGEGMDQVADYLNTLESPQSLTVSSRFFKYLLNFEGTSLNLEDERGEWLAADKIIFYVQQVQRMQDPNPGVIRYFQQHVPPEKTITINGIDYAWVYPNPIDTPADLQTAAVPGLFRLFGYRWQATESGGTAVLIGQNDDRPPARMAVRLWAADEPRRQTDWVDCTPLPGFEAVARAAGEVVETACPLDVASLAPGLYSLHVRLKADDAPWHTLDFAAGWSAIEVTADGRARRIQAALAFDALAEAAAPPQAHRLNHIFDDAARLVGYRLEPETIQPGQSAALTLYWQAIRPIRRAGWVSVQAFAGETQWLNLNGPPRQGERPVAGWRPGEVISDTWPLALPADAPAPAIVRLDASLFQPDTLVPWPVRNSAGQDIPAAIGFLRLRPPAWPDAAGFEPLNFSLGDAVRLAGYRLEQSGGAMTLTLRWESLAALPVDYHVFVHLPGPDGQPAAQSDAAPGGGLYPTSVWRPGDVVLSAHTLSLPADAPAGTYRLVAGLYNPADGTRLPVTDAGGQAVPDAAAPLGVVEWP